MSQYTVLEAANEAWERHHCWVSVPVVGERCFSTRGGAETLEPPLGFSPHSRHSRENARCLIVYVAGKAEIAVRRR